MKFWWHCQIDGLTQGISLDDTVAITQDYAFVVLYTSTAGFASDIRLAEQIKARTPEIKIAFVGPHVTVRAEASLQASSAINFVVCGEFDYPVAEFAEGCRLEDIAGVTYRQGDRIIHNPPRQPLQDLDALPFAVDVYKRDLDFTRYSIPCLLHPNVSFYTSCVFLHLAWLSGIVHLLSLAANDEGAPLAHAQQS